MIIYIIIKILIVLTYISNLFELTEGWLHIFYTIFWTPAVFAIIFLKGDKQIMIILVTFGIGIFVEPIVHYNLSGPGASFQALLIFPIVFYFLYLHKDDL